MYADRVAKYIAQYYLELEGKVDGIIFTAGVGENGIIFRDFVLKRLKPIGIIEDEEKNNSIARFKDQKEGIISAENSSVNVYVMQTNEEIMIAKDTFEKIN